MIASQSALHVMEYLNLLHLKVIAAMKWAENLSSLVEIVTSVLLRTLQGHRVSYLTKINYTDY